jgi:pimeloyl-ACP methyl ester carboxylesterase
VRETEILLHGHRLHYRIGGHGPLLVLVHGITNSSATWQPVLATLGQRFTVIAPDLLGHGDSAKPRGDYSLGANASLLRDFMLALGHERATLVGHSLGGGIAMQMAYQLPGAELVLPLLASEPLVNAGTKIGGWIDRIGVRVGSDLAAMAAGFASLQDIEARRAFVHTARAVIDVGGQRVNATDKLYLAEAVPTLILWGDRDPIIPARHGIRAHELMPGSRLRIFAGAGHFPHHDDPVGFAAAITEFVDTTQPSEPDEDRLRRLVVERGTV